MTRPLYPHRSAGQRAWKSGLARALSKLGFCSRTQAHAVIAAGRVKVNGVVNRNPLAPIEPGKDRIEVDGREMRDTIGTYLMLNKPRGLVVTTSDEKGRPTVFACFKDADLPFISPVGRLDQASEGLLLFTNDTQWAARITDPASHLEKTYHVQVDCHPTPSALAGMQQGCKVGIDFLAVKEVRTLRRGTKNSWLEIILEEGKNRHIRRLLDALDIHVLRLVRVAIGPLQLGSLEKGRFRYLTESEKYSLAKPQT